MKRELSFEASRGIEGRALEMIVPLNIRGMLERGEDRDGAIEEA